MRNTQTSYQVTNNEAAVKNSTSQRRTNVMKNTNIMELMDKATESIMNDDNLMNYKCNLNKAKLEIMFLEEENIIKDSLFITKYNLAQNDFKPSIELVNLLLSEEYLVKELQMHFNDNSYTVLTDKQIEVIYTYTSKDGKEITFEDTLYLLKNETMSTVFNRLLFMSELIFNNLSENIEKMLIISEQNKERVIEEKILLDIEKQLDEEKEKEKKIMKELDNRFEDYDLENSKCEAENKTFNLTLKSMDNPYGFVYKSNDKDLLNADLIIINVYDKYPGINIMEVLRDIKKEKGRIPSVLIYNHSKNRYNSYNPSLLYKSNEIEFSDTVEVEIENNIILKKIIKLQEYPCENILDINPKNGCIGGMITSMDLKYTGIIKNDGIFSFCDFSEDIILNYYNNKLFNE